MVLRHPLAIASIFIALSFAIALSSRIASSNRYTVSAMCNRALARAKLSLSEQTNNATWFLMQYAQAAAIIKTVGDGASAETIMQFTGYDIDEFKQKIISQEDAIRASAVKVGINPDAVMRNLMAV